MANSPDDTSKQADRDDRPISDALAGIAKQYNWPDELTRRIAEARVPASSLYGWGWYGLTPEKAAAQLAWHQRLSIGDLRGRDATFTDNEAFSALRRATRPGMIPMTVREITRTTSADTTAPRSSVHNFAIRDCINGVPPP